MLSLLRLSSAVLLVVCCARGFFEGPPASPEGPPFALFRLRAIVDIYGVDSQLIIALCMLRLT